jgi:hypothetical protein
MAAGSGSIVCITLPLSGLDKAEFHQDDTALVSHTLICDCTGIHFPGTV